MRSLCLKHCDNLINSRLYPSLLFQFLIYLDYIARSCFTRYAEVRHFVSGIGSSIHVPNSLHGLSLQKCDVFISSVQNLQ